jgi:type IV pilus assembly protein PilE
MKNRQHGFTLIELMIVVAIVGILAAIAYPTYTEQVRKSRRAEAQAALMGLANAMERYFTSNSTYVGAADGAGVPLIYATQVPIDGGTAFYNLRITAADGTSYMLQATAVGSMASDANCGNLTLSSTGVRGKSGSNTVDYCWSR